MRRSRKLVWNPEILNFLSRARSRSPRTPRGRVYPAFLGRPTPLDFEPTSAASRRRPASVHFDPPWMQNLSYSHLPFTPPALSAFYPQQAQFMFPPGLGQPPPFLSASAQSAFYPQQQAQFMFPPGLGQPPPSLSAPAAQSAPKPAAPVAQSAPRPAVPAPTVPQSAAAVVVVATPKIVVQPKIPVATPAAKPVQVGAPQQPQPQGQELPRCRRLKILAGPRFFAFYKLPEGKRILLLGEQHSHGGHPDPSLPDVQEIQRWLAELGASAPECLDIMVEDDTGGKGFIPRTDDGIEPLPVDKVRSILDVGRGYSIDALRATFEPCLVASRLNCFSKSVRYHVIDMRWMFHWMEHETNGTSYYTRIFMDTKTTPDMPKKSDLPSIISIESNHADQSVTWGTLKTQFKEALDYLTLTSADTAGYDEIVSRTFAKLNENRKNLLKTEVNEYLYTAPDHHKFLQTGFLARVAKAKSKNPQMYGKITAAIKEVYADKLFSKYAAALRLLELFLLDYYVMLRMFTVFTAGRRPPEGCSDDKYSAMKNIIFYGGAAHAQVCDKVLIKLGYARTPPFLDTDVSRKSVTLPAPFDFFA